MPQSGFLVYFHSFITQQPPSSTRIYAIEVVSNAPINSTIQPSIFRLTWKDSYCELKSSISTIAEACDEILKSTGLKHFINLVLLAGNFMGRTKNSKETFAFELVVLNKVFFRLSSFFIHIFSVGRHKRY